MVALQPPPAWHEEKKDTRVIEVNIKFDPVIISEISKKIKTNSSSA